MKKAINLLMFFVIIRRLVYLGLAAIDRLLGKTNPIVIFCYHSIANDQWRFGVDPREFKKQISYMLTHYKPITLTDLYRYLKGTKKLHEPSFVITFDDGYKDVTKVKKILENLSIKPTVFVLSGKNINRQTLGTNRQLLSQKDIKDLQKSGWEIGYHGMTHTPLTRVNGNIEEEISSSYKYFSYPKGRYSKRIISNLKKNGYKMALTMEDSIISTKTDPYVIPRIGVDSTHNFIEFKSLASPSVVKFRSLIKHSFLGRYL